MKAYNNGAGSSGANRTDPRSAAAKYYARYRARRPKPRIYGPFQKRDQNV